MTDDEARARALAEDVVRQWFSRSQGSMDAWINWRTVWIDQLTVQFTAAFREVRDAIHAQGNARETLDAQRGREQALARTLELARLRYDNGAIGLFELLETERQLFAARLEAIDAERARREAIVDLYLALGA